MNIVPFLALASCLETVLAQAPTIPSQDIFYTPPSNVSYYKPGQVIRSRQINPELSGLLANNVSVAIKEFHQYLYRTTDSLGNPVAALTSLLVPSNADPTKLLAYQTAYDSANNDCSPSFTLQAKSGNASTTDIVFISAALNNGWFVVSPDYEGLNAQYVAGVQAGLATLDSVRAALTEGQKAGVSPHARYAMWGYSGGSLASEWAAELQPSYAPELNFQGAALGGLIPNVTNVLLTINKGSFAGLAFAGMQGLAKAYPNLTQYLDQHLLPDKRADYNHSGDGCLAQDSMNGQNKDLFSYTDNGNQSLYDAVPVSVLAAAGQMGTHGVPNMPLFVYKANGDEVSPAVDTDKVVELLCGKGATIEYHKDLIGEHISEGITGSASAFSWISDRLAAKPVANQGKCVTKYVALTSLDIGTVVALGEELIAILQTLFGKHTAKL